MVVAVALALAIIFALMAIKSAPGGGDMLGNRKNESSFFGWCLMSPTLYERHPYKRDPEIFPPIKPEHAQAIGYVAAYWSLVEESLGVAIGFLLQLPPIVRAALTAEMSTVSRTQMIRTLIEVSGDVNALADWTVLAREIDQLRSRRNDVVHAVWEVAGHGHHSKRVKAKGRFRIDCKPVETAELMALAEAILDISDKLVSFISSVILSSIPTDLADPFLMAPSNPTADDQRPKRVRVRRASSASRRKAFDEKG